MTNVALCGTLLSVSLLSESFRIGGVEFGNMTGLLPGAALSFRYVHTSCFWDIACVGYIVFLKLDSLELLAGQGKVHRAAFNIGWILVCIVCTASWDGVMPK